jgi:methylmalonyl-CoA epimerase
MSQAFPWEEPARLDHVGILTADFAWADSLFAHAMGLELSRTERVDAFGVDLLWVHGLDVPLELISPFDRDSRAARRLRERGAGADHVAFRVESIEASFGWCRENGIPTVDPAPRPGSRGMKVGFLEPADTGGLRIELVEA